jgi:hypothetical protein
MSVAVAAVGSRAGPWFSPVCTATFSVSRSWRPGRFSQSRSGLGTGGYGFDGPGARSARDQFRQQYGAASWQTLNLLHQQVDRQAGRLCLGTDYPFRGALRRAVDDVRSQALPAAEEAAILGGNVARWFR